MADFINSIVTKCTIQENGLIYAFNSSDELICIGRLNPEITLESIQTK